MNLAFYDANIADVIMRVSNIKIKEKILKNIEKEMIPCKSTVQRRFI